MADAFGVVMTWRNGLEQGVKSDSGLYKGAIQEIEGTNVGWKSFQELLKALKKLV